MLAPDRARQPVRRRVRKAKRLFLGVERDDRHDRPEDLLLRDPHVVRHVVEDRRHQVCAIGERRIRRRLASDHDLGALLEADLDVVADPLSLLLADERADLGRVGERVADLDVPRRVGEQLDDLVVHRALHEDPAPGAAVLAAVVEALYGDSRANFSRSASAKTMLGLLPPSSSEIFFTFAEASRMISWPVVVSPVNATLPMPGWAAIEAPAVPPGPVTTLSTPAGMPASSASSPSRIAVNGE